MIISKERNIANNVDVFFENKAYIVKSVSNSEELLQAQKLRYKAFFLDTNKKVNPLGTDEDEYDRFFDHLIILDKTQNNRVIGTYRLTCSLFTRNFYSKSEFNISEILNIDGIKVELGRAAIDKEYRNGIVFIMLWKGILQYATMVGAQYIFGCSSIDVEDFSTVASIRNQVKKSPYYSTDFTVTTNKKYSMTHHNLLPVTTINDDSFELPSLIKFYAKSGAVLLGEPAIDTEFQCIDFFTFIDLDKAITTKRVNKFKKI